MFRVLIVVFILLGSAVNGVADAAPKVITWDDLVPKFEPIDDPFGKLDPLVIEDLRRITAARSDLAKGLIERESAEYHRILILERALKAEGIDVEGLIRATGRLTAEIARRNATKVPELDGRLVRIAGYALPLEQNASGVTEFLLVPYVGACIHVPPPPQNQTVYVKLSSPYKLDSLFEAVWVTGLISAEGNTRSLSFVDGTAPVQTGYTVTGLAIEPYE